MPRYKGFLFAHYDSRGGTTFMEGDDLAEATARYATAFGYPDILEEGESKEEFLEGCIEEDYMGKATIDSDIPLEFGMDLDAGMNDIVDGVNEEDNPTGVTAWVVGEHEVDDANFLCDYVNEHPDGIWIHYGRKPSEPSFAPRWDDDSYGLLFIPKGYDCTGKMEGKE